MLHCSESSAIDLSGMGAVHKMQISMAAKLTLHGGKNCGEKKLTVQKEKKKGSNSFSSAPNTCETYGAHSYAAIARLGHVIVNTVTCCYSHTLNTVILTCFSTMFRLRKIKCYESFESKFCVWWGGGGGGGLDFRIFLSNQFPCLTYLFHMQTGQELQNHGRRLPKWQ